ncbi:hypothetical protein Bca101_047738 [Brassica carinata]
MTVGVLALQGSFNEHIAALRRLGVQGVEIRKAEDVRKFPALREFVKTGKPVWGTCAGLIFLADRAVGQKEGGQELVGGLDCTVHRNFFGSQIQSFEADISVPLLTSKEGGAETFRGVFIRAPAVLDVGPGVEVLARCPVPSNKVLYSSSTVQIQDEDSSGNEGHCCCEAKKLVSNCVSSRVNRRHAMAQLFHEDDERDGTRRFFKQ